MRLSLAVLALAVDVASAASFSDYVHDLSRNAMLLGGILRQKTTSILSMHSTIPNSETPGTYAPIINAACPSTLVRQPSDGSPRLLSSERDWVGARRAKVIPAWSSYLKNPALDLGSFNVNSFISNSKNLPQVAIAASGGGYRAMLHVHPVFSPFQCGLELSFFSRPPILRVPRSSTRWIHGLPLRSNKGREEFCNLRRISLGFQAAHGW